MRGVGIHVTRKERRCVFDRNEHCNQPNFRDMPFLELAQDRR
jgi:hypothetical protein